MIISDLSRAFPLFNSHHENPEVSGNHETEEKEDQWECLPSASHICCHRCSSNVDPHRARLGNEGWLCEKCVRKLHVYHEFKGLWSPPNVLSSVNRHVHSITRGVKSLVQGNRHNPSH